ncbi:uncharacterized protein LOC122798509 [Protopterus annectens]|uniref:uncharacterized protein LOC122798509 n=1 Tax=Protopterus annectens TaxID=7888 RepID=UPI001CFC3A51|nr:uncharacterized protein LOC122798509 [Protopterus annectens]
MGYCCTTVIAVDGTEIKRIVSFKVFAVFEEKKILSTSIFSEDVKAHLLPATLLKDILLSNSSDKFHKKLEEGVVKFVKKEPWWDNEDPYNQSVPFSPYNPSDTAAIDASDFAWYFVTQGAKSPHLDKTELLISEQSSSPLQDTCTDQLLLPEIKKITEGCTALAETNSKAGVTEDSPFAVKENQTEDKKHELQIKKKQTEEDHDYEYIDDHDVEALRKKVQESICQSDSPVVITEKQMDDKHDYEYVDDHAVEDIRKKVQESMSQSKKNCKNKRNT